MLFYSEGSTYGSCVWVGYGICFNIGFGSLPLKRPALVASAI